MKDNFQILVNGKPVRQYEHEGQIYVEGRPGSEYSIKIKNPNWNRSKVILSVDGLSVMDGQPASENSSGYILNSRESITIDGWRISNNEVRKFQFGRISNSYSNKSGHGKVNCGVIGIMIFEERSYPPLFRENPFHYYSKTGYTTTSDWIDNSSIPVGSGTTMGAFSASSMSSTTGATRLRSSNSRRIKKETEHDSNSLGTEMGDYSDSKVYEVTFESKELPSHTFSIFYDDARGLRKRGIDIKKINYRPNPFPASQKFCVEV